MTLYPKVNLKSFPTNCTMYDTMYNTQCNLCTLIFSDQYKFWCTASHQHQSASIDPCSINYEGYYTLGY